MIRSLANNDYDELVILADGTGLFEADELEVLKEVIDAFYEGELGEGHCWVVDEKDGELVSVAYFAPEDMADRVWNIYLIAVRQDLQGQRLGGEMLQYVEDVIEKHGGRMVVVETSAMQRYENARNFYKKHCYEEEGRVRDFYKEGEDKVIFRKLLSR